MPRSRYQRRRFSNHYSCSPSLPIRLFFLFFPIRSHSDLLSRGLSIGLRSAVTQSCSRHPMKLSYAAFHSSKTNAAGGRGSGYHMHSRHGRAEGGTALTMLVRICHMSCFKTYSKFHCAKTRAVVALRFNTVAKPLRCSPPSSRRV